MPPFRGSRKTEAAQEDRIALELTSNPAEMTLLQRRIEDALFVVDGHLDPS